MKDKERKWFMDALQRQRAHLVGEVTDLEAELHSIQEEQESEREELAQEESAARTLVHLDDRAKHEIVEIDAALRRLTEGTYGICDGCGNLITEERLRAVLATRLCVACARDRESDRPMIPPQE